MIDPICIGMVKEYVLKSDIENPTIWLIGSLDSMAASKIISQAGRVEFKDGKPVFVSDNDIADNDFTIVKYGLKGFKNFKINGEEVKFETTKERLGDEEMEVATKKILSMIPLYAIHELAMEIWGSNHVSPELRKN